MISRVLIAIAVSAVFSSTGAMAAKKIEKAEKAPVVRDVRTIRAELVKKYGTENPIAIGIAVPYASNVDMHTFSNSLISFGNTLSQKTDRLVYFVPEPDDSVLARDIQSGRLKYVYCEYERCTTAAKAGFKPFARYVESGTGVVIAKRAKGFKDESNLSGKTIGILGNKLFAEIVKNDLSGLKANFPNTIGMNKHEISAAMNTDKFDAIVVPSFNLNDILANHGAAYQIISKTKGFPRYTFMAAADADVGKLGEAMVAANPDTPEGRAELLWTGAETLTGAPFTAAGSGEEDAFKRLVEVSDSLGIKVDPAPAGVAKEAASQGLVDAATASAAAEPSDTPAEEPKTEETK